MLSMVIKLLAGLKTTNMLLDRWMIRWGEILIYSAPGGCGARELAVSGSLNYIQTGKRRQSGKHVSVKTNSSHTPFTAAVTTFRKDCMGPTIGSRSPLA